MYCQSVKVDIFQHLCIITNIEMGSVFYRFFYTVFLYRFSFTVRQKTRQPTYIDNFAKYQSIFKILSLLDAAQNLLQNDHYISHHILKTLLHFFVKPHD